MADFNAKMADLKNMKTRMEGTTSAASEFRRHLERAEGAWADMAPWGPKLKAAMELIDSCKSHSEFWCQWSLLGDASLKGLARPMRDEDLDREIGYKGVVADRISALESLNQKVMNIYKVSTS